MLTRMKHLKILESQFNKCFRTTFHPGMYFFCCFFNIIATFLCVSVGSRLFSEIGNWMFVIVFFNSLVVILIFGYLSGVVNQKSKMGINLLKRQRQVNLDRKIFRREIASCAPIKIRFGNNYVDRKTPLVMMTFCIKMATKLLLSL